MQDDIVRTSASRPSKKQKELLSFIDTFIAGHGYGPSYREVMRALDYKSVSTVAVHVNGLITKGFLRKRDRSARSLEVCATTLQSKENTSITASEEKWLIDRVSAAFTEYATQPTDKKRDDLFVLVGALSVLGLSEAATAFKSRLPKA